jgi:hypothetical protein
MRGIFKTFPYFYMFEENGKSRTDGGGGIVGRHVTSWQGKPVDLAVSVRVATKR